MGYNPAMILTEAPIRTPEQQLAAMQKYNISNLEIYTENQEIFEELPARFIDDILAAYHTSYMRVLALGLESTEVPKAVALTEFPQAKIIITRSREIFKTFYFNIKLFDSLPDWVTCYVNFGRGIYVMYLPSADKRSTGITIDESAHEFNHITIANILELPVEFLLKQWDSWLREYAAVSINQAQPDGWLAAEIASRENQEIPTLLGIKERSIFGFDSRPPEQNIAYQYCVIVGNELGNAIKAKRYPSYIANRVPPQYAIFALTQEAYHSQKEFSELIAELSIDMLEVEQQARLRHGLPPITSDSI